MRATEARICVTLDADFRALLAVGGASGPSVIRIRREGLRGEAVADLLTGIWPQIESAALEGAFVVVDEHAVRIRRLPILR